jgi:hypothetical protein
MECKILFQWQTNFAIPRVNFFFYIRHNTVQYTAQGNFRFDKAKFYLLYRTGLTGGKLFWTFFGQCMSIMQIHKEGVLFSFKVIGLILS